MLKYKSESNLFLHQILQMCDPLCILWVAADVVLVKEGLLKKRMSQKMRISQNIYSIQKSNSINLRIRFSLPPDIWQCRRSQQHLWPHLDTCWAGLCCHDAVCVGTGWSESAAPGSYSPPQRWRFLTDSPPPEWETRESEWESSTANLKTFINWWSKYENISVYLSHSLTSSLLSTSNQREMPGRGWVRIRVVLSIQRLWNTRHNKQWEKLIPRGERLKPHSLVYTNIIIVKYNHCKLHCNLLYKSDLFHDSLDFWSLTGFY